MTFAQILTLKYSPDQPRDEDGKWRAGETAPVAQKLRAHYDSNNTEDQVLHAFPTKTQQMVARTKADIAEAIQQGKITAQMHATKNARGQNAYSKERLKLHDKILNDLFSPQAIAAARPAAGEQPTAYFLGGRGGSGKSQFSKAVDPEHGVYDPKKVIALDPDDIKERLGLREKGGDGGYHGWNAFTYHEESGDVMDKALRLARKLKVNVVVDQTMKSDPSHKIKQFKSKGFRTEGHYMFLPEAMAAQRAVGRYENGGDFKGRFVPPDIVLGNKNNEANFDKNIPLFDNWSVRRNDVKRGESAKLVAQKEQ